MAAQAFLADRCENVTGLRSLSASGVLVWISEGD
jgi:hypothetical protein